ncbi:MAG: helix-turn-helix transcriptional regulator [Firmicutes bacterium]|nr:helix-turn-helix transcriptional regulator [Bacillota bacterium]
MENKTSFHDDYYYYDIVRKNIKKYRKSANLTQQELADKIEVSMHYISQIESANPNKYFTLVVIGRIADVLNIDIRQLFDDIDNTK